MPESQVYYADGTPVPHDKAAEAVAAGKAFGLKDKPLHMIDETGAPVKVEAGNLREAVKAGFGFEDPAEAAKRQALREHGTAGQQAIAAVEGGARGLSFGTSDALAGAVLGDEYSEHARKRQQANPITATGSEILGAVAPAIASGGSGLLARGAALTPAGLAARAGSAAERLVGRGAAALGAGEGTLARMATRAAQVGASGATESALQGLGGEISKAALENTDLTAEKLLSGAIEGGKFGGLVGAGMGATGTLAGKAAEKLLGSESVRERARQLADESLLKAFGFQGSDFRRLVGRKVGQAADDRLSAVAKEAFDYRFKSGPLEGQKLFTGAKKAEDLIDSVTFAKREIGEELGNVRRQTDEILKARPELGADTAGYLRRVDEEVLKPLRGSMSPTIQGQADRVEAELAQLRNRVEAPPIRVRMADGTTEIRPREPVSFSELEDFRRNLRDIIQPPKPAGGGLPAPVPEHAAHLEKAERMLSEELDNSVERAISSSGGDASKFKELKREYSAFSDLEAVSNKAAKQQLGNRALSPSDYGTGLGMAMSMLASGNVAGLAAGAATSFGHKLVREYGRSVLAQMAHHVATLDDEAIGAIRKIAGEAGKVPRRVIQSAESIDRRYDEVSDSVKQFQSDPRKAQQVLASNVEAIAGEHPELAAAIQTKIQGDYQYLAQQIPGQLSRADSSLTPLAAKGRIPHAAKTKIVNIATALERPNSILEDLARGNVPREKIEAIKARRPETFAEMRGLVMKHVAVKRDEIPYLDRVQLSLAFDFNGDKSLRNIGAIQADNSTPPPEDQANPPGGVSSLNPEKVAEGTSLPSQRAEA